MKVIRIPLRPSRPYPSYKMSGIWDKKIFNTVTVEFDSISWNNGADLDPEVLYEDSLPLTS